MKYKIVPELSKGKWVSEDDQYVFVLYRKDGFFNDWRFVWTYYTQEEAEAGIKRDLEFIEKYKKDLEDQKKKDRDHLSKKVIYKDVK